MPFHAIEDPVKLKRVLEATLLLESDLELPVLLSHVVDEARFLTGARYGALGILDGGRTVIVDFLAVGLTGAEEDEIARRPTGRGVLGLFMEDPRSIRLAHLGSHPDSVGFPAGHPPMESFLGVPIKVRNEIYGSLYLTDKVGAAEFTDEDQSLVEALAVAAGMAIENTRLHQRVQELAVSDDRDRMARDLHDTVVQHLYAVGLTLEAMAKESAAAGMADRLGALVTDIGTAIRQVRSSIYELGLENADRGLRAGVLTLVRSLGPMVGFDIRVSFEGPVDSVVPEVVTEHLIATIREAVTNIGRHAGASAASVTVIVHTGVCQLQIVDNGRGFDAGGSGHGGLGLANMRRRAEKLHGAMEVERPADGGTSLTWRVPITQ